MRILLDSNAYSRLMRGDDQTAAVVRDATELLMSAVVIGELLYGFRNGSRFDRNVIRPAVLPGQPLRVLRAGGFHNRRPILQDRGGAPGEGQSHPDQRRVDRGPRHGNGSRPGVGGPSFRGGGRHRVAAAGQPEPIGARRLMGNG